VTWAQHVPGKWDLVAMLMKADQKLHGAFLPVKSDVKMALAVKQSRLRLGGPDTIMNA
jgi:hypothetical protein